MLMAWIALAFGGMMQAEFEIPVERNIMEIVQMS